MAANKMFSFVFVFGVYELVQITTLKQHQSMGENTPKRACFFEKNNAGGEIKLLITGLQGSASSLNRLS